MLALLRKILLHLNWHRRLKKRKNIIDRPTLLEQYSHQVVRYLKEKPASLSFKNFEFFGNKEQNHQPHFVRYFDGRSISIDQPFYLYVKNGILIGHMAVATIGKDILLESTNNSMYYLDKTGDAKYLQRLEEPIFAKAAIKRAISLVNILSNNYYHWIVDLLPLIQPVYQELLDDPGFKVFVRKDAAAFQYETLKILGLEKNIVPWTSQKMSFDELLISSFRNFTYKTAHGSYEIISPSSLNWLQTALLKSLPSDTIERYENIYISRNKSTGRRIQNENELDRILDKYGIKKIFPEDHPISDQIRIFQYAKRVIGPHGAGFTNILFSKNQTVLEFFPKGRKYFASFHQIASSMGHRYIFVEIPGINKKEDMNIDINDFEFYLKKIF